MDYKKEMIKIFESMRYKHDMYNLFSDFCEISAITISNSVDKVQFDKREARYFELIKKYEKQDLEKFAQILANLVMALGQKPDDVLGTIFMEMNLGNEWKGQFFTPMSVSNLCGSLSAEGCEKIVEQEGFITLNDPAVGGGAMIIGFVNAMIDRHLNPQQQLSVVAMDIDSRAVHMCYIQLSLLGIPAIVNRADSILYKFYEEWLTPFYILGGWRWKKKSKPENIKKVKKVKKVKAEIVPEKKLKKIRNMIPQKKVKKIKKAS